jgi:hypothetical protein
LAGWDFGCLSLTQSVGAKVRDKTATMEFFVKIITYDRFKPGVTMETITPYLVDEVSNVWRLWKAGIVRENYARADEPGVVIVFECDSVEQCKRYTDDFPLTPTQSTMGA